jgi:MOSC domain-containing protein YiiM
LKGRVVAVCRSAEKEKPKEDVRSGFFERGLGLVGDAHAGTRKQVSILTKEKVDQLAQKTGISFPPGAFAENLLVEGLQQIDLVPGRQIRVGSSTLLIERVGKEASTPHSYQYRGHSLLPYFGIFARVLESGLIKNGDEIELLNPAS